MAMLRAMLPNDRFNLFEVCFSFSETPQQG